MSNIATAQVRAVDGKAYADFEITIRDVDQLNGIIGTLRRVKGVESVVRQRTLTSARESAEGKGSA